MNSSEVITLRVFARYQEIMSQSYDKSITLQSWEIDETIYFLVLTHLTDSADDARDLFSLVVPSGVKLCIFSKVFKFECAGLRGD